ncbi:MAG: primase related protein [Clostridiaceae bacterium]|jgi:hypothetical protein|nr:primase related protein [Clostridiaceae bacterium]
MFDAILPQLQDKKKNFNTKDKENYSFKCTHHQDKTASAYIAHKSDGGIVAGCRTCGSSYGLNTLLSDIGLNKMDFVEKSETYFSKENLMKYIREGNVGNVTKDGESWIVDNDYAFDNAYFYSDERGTLVSVKIKYKLVNPAADKKKKKFVQRVIRENKIISASVETVDQLPKQYIYNAAGVQNAIRSNKYVYLVEGEKDADTLIFNGLVATSFATGAGSMFDDYKSQLRGAKLVICSDFDGPGRNHVEKVREFLFDEVQKMYIVEYLPELSKVQNDKADVTDWLNAGHTIKEFTEYVFESCLDVKNFWNLQEYKDLGYGIYKCKEGNAYDKKQLTNFTIDGINIINRVDTEEEYFEMIIRTHDKKTLKRRGSILVFNDVRKFRDFLNSSDLVFRGTIDILIDLKEWCFKYKKRDTTTAYDVGGIRNINGKWLFVTSEGSFDGDFVYDKSKMYYDYDNFEAFQYVELPTKEEVKKIYESLINFNKKEITYTTLGHVGAMLLNGKYKALDIKLNHLAIFGEAGAGKSTIAEKVIMPLMNYNVKSNARDVTNFGFLKETSTNTTTPFFADEYKPSTFMLKKNQELSNLFRNIYDGNSSVRGNKNLQTTKITPVRPLVVIGEEGFWQDETALIERSNIIYASKATRNEESLQHINNLIKNKEILNKFGKLLVKIALDTDESKFLDFRKKCDNLVDFKDRIFTTFANTVQGLNIVRIAFKYYGIELDFKEGVEFIKSNICENVLQNNAETKTQIEKMFEIIDEMISTHVNVKDGIRVDKESGVVYIYIPYMYPIIKKYLRDFNREENVLEKNDFIKQLKGSKYLMTDKTMPVRINGAVKKSFKLNLDLLDNLGLDNICTFEPISEEDYEQIPFKM